MKKPEIAKKLARDAGLSEAEAADHLDRVVRQILSELRRGRQAELPGLGRFVHGPDGWIAFEREAAKHD